MKKVTKEKIKPEEDLDLQCINFDTLKQRMVEEACLE